MITSTDKRMTARCMCGCGTVATLPHFRIVVEDEHRFPVLPQHEKRFRERAAATRHLVDIVGARHGFWRRQWEAKTIYRLHRTIGSSLRVTIRAAVLYALPVPLRPIIGPLLR